MNEEEKQAIEELKETIKYIDKNGSMYCDNEDKDNMRILLNLIEKQQKEIEELKERNQTCIKESDLMNAVSFLMNRNDMSNYISKDKIREKKEEITSYAYTSAEERDCQDYAIQVLKDLLGD